MWLVEVQTIVLRGGVCSNSYFVERLKLNLETQLSVHIDKIKEMEDLGLDGESWENAMYAMFGYLCFNNVYNFVPSYTDAVCPVVSHFSSFIGAISFGNLTKQTNPHFCNSGWRSYSSWRQISQCEVARHSNVIVWQRRTLDTSIRLVAEQKKWKSLIDSNIFTAKNNSTM